MNIDKHEFVTKNKTWLRMWMFSNTMTDDTDLQVFKVGFPREFMQDKYWRELEHDLLCSAVFSERSHFIDECAGEFYTMSGFFELKGRLPTVDDRVVFLYNNYHDERFIVQRHLWRGDDDIKFIGSFSTRCKIKII